MSILGFFKGNGKSGFGYDSTTADVTDGLDLSGQTILITGCSSGLGQETMHALCARGARVIGAARSIEKATTALRTWAARPRSLPARSGIYYQLDSYLRNTGVG